MRSFWKCRRIQAFYSLQVRLRRTRRLDDAVRGFSKMRWYAKLSLTLAIAAVSFVIAPAAKADTITITSGGFAALGLGNDGMGDPMADALDGFSHTSQDVSGANSFCALLNPLRFTTGNTGTNSIGSHSTFTLSQFLTINGQTQVLNIVGSIDITNLVDTVHLSAAPLTFNFNTFSVVVNVMPTDVSGSGPAACAELKANFTVIPNTAVPEPATLTQLGIGLAGTAAKLRKRRKRKES